MNRSILMSAFLALVIGVCSPTFAAIIHVHWQGDESADWNTPGNWSTGAVPPGTDAVNMSAIYPDDTAGAVCTYTAAQGTSPMYGYLMLGYNGGGYNFDGRLDITGGTLQVGRGATSSYWGQQGKSCLLNITGGELFSDASVSGAATQISRGGSVSVVNVTGTGVWHAYGTASYVAIGAGETGTATLNIGGGGTVIFDRRPYFDSGSSQGVVNFLPGTTGSWTVVGQDYNWFKSLYDGDDLTYNGTNLQPFADVFQVAGSTLSLVAVPVPEPSSIVLLTIGLLAIMTYGRRKRE